MPSSLAMYSDGGMPSTLAKTLEKYSASEKPESDAIYKISVEERANVNLVGRFEKECIMHK